MVFCNEDKILKKYDVLDVTILILIDGFLQCLFFKCSKVANAVTILILIDGFLQSELEAESCSYMVTVTILILIDGFLQFNWQMR